MRLCGRWGGGKMHGKAAEQRTEEKERGLSDGNG